MKKEKVNNLNELFLRHHCLNNLNGVMFIRNRKEQIIF